MQGIGRIVGWSAFLKALLLLTMSAVLVFSVSRALSAFSWLPLYQNQFTFTPGDWFAWRLNDARRDPGTTCLLVGASSVREGLSSSIFEEELTGTKVVNLGATGGHSAIDAIEVQARILADQGHRYKCIVVGLHPVFLRKFDRNAYNLVTTDYVALLSFADLFDLSKKPWTFPDKAQLASRYFVPLGQQSLILKRLMRLSLYNAHRSLIDASEPRKNFEEVDDEFMPQQQSGYAGQAPVLKDIEESYTAQIKEIGWDRASSFGGGTETSALHHSLRLLSGLTDQLIVIEMPESHLFQNADRVARPPYEAALSSSNVSMKVLRCVVPGAQELENFHDAIHLNETGRMRISRSIARILASGPQQADDLCHVRLETK